MDKNSIPDLYLNKTRRAKRIGLTNTCNETKKDSQPFVKDSSTLTQILCMYLEKEEFEIDSAIEVIKNLKTERLLYSEISNRLFSFAQKDNSDSRNVAIFVSNVDILKEKILNTNNAEYEDIKPIVLKLYDHTQLANHQVSVFKVGQEQFDTYLKNSDYMNKKDSTISAKLDNAVDQMTTKVDSKIESVTSQVVSLVALFTAMSFLVFGGLSSFESIFSNIQDTSLLKLIILSSVWGFAILNTIAIFMFFTSRVVGKSFKISVQNANTLFKQYPYIILSNYTLLSILLFSSWLYMYVKKFGYKLPESYCQASVYLFIGSLFFMIVFLTVLGFILFKKKIRTENSNPAEK